MPMLSPLRAGVPLLEGLELLNRGKVRDTYRLGNGLLLSVCTEGLSIFDFVLNALVPQKDMVLTALSHFWLTRLEEHGIKTHFVAAGASIDPYLPEHLRGNVQLQCTSMVVKELVMDKAEFIGRICLAGSVLGEYLRTGIVNGVKLPPGLEDGDKLPYVLDTPTTKADEGHDEPLDAASVRAQYPQQTLLTVQISQIIAEYARTRGILCADFKFEFGRDEEGVVTLGDEVGTPDSSRFWSLEEWQKSRGLLGRKAPSPYDKQLVRDEWGKKHGLDKKDHYDPKNPDDVRRVHQLVVPDELIRATTKTYRYIFWRLTGMTLEQYFRKLGVDVSTPKKKIALAFGSESDLNLLGGLFDRIDMSNADGDPSVNIVSCHRNPNELYDWVKQDCGGADVVIAAGGLALALPGIIDALAHSMGKRIPVVGVAMGQEGSLGLLAAQLSIQELPNTPVIIDEMTGKAYSGLEGLKAAVRRVLDGELPHPKPRTARQAKFNLSPEFLFGN